MSNLERLSMMKICSTDNKDVPIKIETNEELRFAISLVANRSDKIIKLSILFDEQDQNVLREFNFEVRHSPMPPDGTLRIP
ncbi:hypothetical protein [Aeromonas rivipollensis]|uniref:hypothetical protein n=1 Tax=Aeromonas rivipollensis TaxID=948519 RepID=UPI003D1C076D